MKILNRRNQPLLFLTLSGILALAYFLTGKLAASMLGLVKAEASPLWPPAGIALAALLLQGRRMWPGITLGSLLLSSTVAVGIPSTVIVTSAFSVTLQALAGEILLSRFGFSIKLDRLRDVLGLITGAVIATLFGSTISNLSAYIFGWVEWSNLFRNWWTMWLGDSMGILIVTPLLLTLSHCRNPAVERSRNPVVERSRNPVVERSRNPVVEPLDPWTSLREHPISLVKVPKFYTNFQFPISNFQFPNLIVNYLEPLILLTLLVSVSWLVFGCKTNASTMYPLEYLPFPLVVWAALRWSPRGAIFAYSIVAYIAIWGAVQGGGPFLVKSDDLKQAVLFLQAFIATIAIVALMLAAAVAERQQALVEVRRTAAMLRDREASLANAQRIAQLGNWDLHCSVCHPTGNCEQFREQDRPPLELRWSDELYRLLGFIPGTVKPTPEVFLQAVHPEDRELVARSQNQAIFERQPYCIEYRIVLSDGSERTVCEQSEINSNVIAATVQDVTDRHRATIALQASFDRDRLLSEMALRIRHSLDLQEILNTTVAEVRQFFKADRTFIGILSPQEVMAESPVYGKIVAESVATEYRSILGWELTDNSYLELLRTFYATNRARSVSDTASIQVPDVVAKYYADYQIRGTLNVPIVLDNQLFGLLAVNQCSGSRQWQEFEIDLLEKLATQVAIALQQSQLLQQVKALNANLESQVAERTKQLQQKMHELQESNLLKDLFLHAVSHNLRTPVMGMLMLMKNLLNKASAESQQTVPIARSILERIVEGSEHQLGMVNSLLDAHATEIEGIAINTAPLQLQSLISTVVVNLESLLAKNQATLIQQIPADLPLVFADSQQLQRVLENLLINAIKHNPPGVHISCKVEVIEVDKMLVNQESKQILKSLNNPQLDSCINQHFSPSNSKNQSFDIGCKSSIQPLEISIENQDMCEKTYLDSNYKLPRYQGRISNQGCQLPRSTVKMVRTVVADDGVGISPKQCESLFELYVQDSNSRQLTGLGLGLYLSKQIIKAHGGKIGVENTPGGGSTFWFSLPVMTVDS
jgi:signal transduction histidine kinase/integral membrane sensor domain MASE1